MEAKDTVLTARPKDSVSLSEVLDRLGPKPTTKTSGGATLSLSRNGNQIDAKCECEELKAAVTLYKEIIEFYREKETRTDTTQTVVEKEIPGWMKPFLYLGIVFVVGTFLLAFLYIRKLPGRIISGSL